VSRQPNYYRILDVALQADQAEIQHAYRVLAKRYHPDRVPRERRGWARTQMARINAAYEVLGDPARRATYDRQQGYVGGGTPYAGGTTRAGGNTDVGRSRRTAARPDRQTGGARTPVRRERWRRERMSRERLRLLGSAVALGVLLLGALYWWRKPGLGLPRDRLIWGLLLVTGLALFLIALRRARR
jgi:DnaJ-class molecular chaperone